MKKFFDGRDALGQHIIIDHAEKAKDRPLEIVGVVGNTRHDSLAIELDSRVLHSLRTGSRSPDVSGVANFERKVDGLENSARGAIHEIDRDIYVPLIETAGGTDRDYSGPAPFQYDAARCLRRSRNDPRRDRNLRRHRLHRNATHERVRHSDGARCAAKRHAANDFALDVVAIGLAVGLLAALALTRLMASLLYGVSAHDFSIYALGTVCPQRRRAGRKLSTSPARHECRSNGSPALRMKSPIKS